MPGNNSRKFFGIVEALVNVRFNIFFSVGNVKSQSDIYVSRVKGNDSKSCGSQDHPCFTISQAVFQAQFGSSIFLDSTKTSVSPYDCQPQQTSYHPGIYVNKALSFFGVPSLAHVSCRKGQNWIANGTDSSIQLNLTRISFQNSQFHLIETSVAVHQCVFSNTQTLVMNISVIHRNLTSFLFQSVCFEHNEACISVTSSYGNSRILLYINIDMNNVTFNRNGLRLTPILPSPSWTILGVRTAGKHLIDLQIKDSSLYNNYVRSSGMIYVKNQLGRTNFLIENAIFKNNGLKDSREQNSLFVLTSSVMSLVIFQSQVKNSKQRLLSISSTTAEISVSHTTADDFQNPRLHGGMFWIESILMKLLFKNCSFSNGKFNPAHGGLLFVSARNIDMLIENSHLTKLTTIGFGGVVYATAKPSTGASMKLNIINCTFISNKATAGGVIYAQTKGVISIQNSKFITNTASSSGGFLNIYYVHQVRVSIQSSLFEGNSAASGGCINAQSSSEEHFEFILRMQSFIRNKAQGPGGVMNCGVTVVHVSISDVFFQDNYAIAAPGGVFFVTNDVITSMFNLTATRVRFIGNIVGGPGRAFYLESSLRTTLVFNDVDFQNNRAKDPGGAIYIEQFSKMYPPIFQIMTKRCIFENNTAFLGGAISLTGNNAVFISEDSIFRFNVATVPGGALALQMSSNFTLNLVNTTFYNNTSTTEAGGAVYLDVGGESRVHIVNSNFEANSAIQSLGASLAISTSGDALRQSGCKRAKWRAWKYNNSVDIIRTHFISNQAGRGGAVSMTDGSLNFTNCTFLNNIASDEGRHLINYGTNSLNLINCTFLQTFDDVWTSTLIHTYSSGPLVLTSTTVDRLQASGHPALIMVSNGGLVEFSDSTSIICPSGMHVSLLNLSYTDWINTSCSLDVTVLRIQCKQCEQGKYSLQRGHTKGLTIVDDFTCLPCPYGAYCDLTIEAMPNFWGYLVEKRPPTLRFILCPDNYCVADQYNWPHFGGYNSCNKKRDGFMCGHCEPGYSKTLFSAHCKRSQDCDDKWFWLVFLAFVFVMASFLVFKPPVVTFVAKQAFWFKQYCITKKTRNVNETESLNEDEIDSTFLLSRGEIENENLQDVGYLEIIFYFYQISNLLLSSFSFERLLDTAVLIPFQGFFNFQERFFEHQSSVCPFPGLTRYDTRSHIFHLSNSLHIL